MRIYLIYFIMFLLKNNFIYSQENYKITYINNKYSVTQNKSFINKQLIFVQDNDTIKLNLKLPINKREKTVFNVGIYKSCHLKKDSTYTIKLTKICSSKIPKNFNSYYFSNAIFDNKNNCSLFKEVKRNTKYNYYGNYQNYIDINNELYEIIDITPKEDCLYLY